VTASDFWQVLAMRVAKVFARHELYDPTQQEFAVDFIARLDSHLVILGIQEPLIAASEAVHGFQRRLHRMRTLAAYERARRRDAASTLAEQLAKLQRTQ
jgi:hypothetical protein